MDRLVQAEIELGLDIEGLSEAEIDDRIVDIGFLAGHLDLQAEDLSTKDPAKAKELKNRVDEITRRIDSLIEAEAERREIDQTISLLSAFVH